MTLLLAATDPTLPVNISALAALIGIVFWLVKRSDTADEARDGDLASTRKELQEARREHVLRMAELNAKLDVAGDLRHKLIGEVSAARSALVAIEIGLQSCTCDNMDYVRTMVRGMIENNTHKKKDPT